MKDRPERAKAASTPRSTLTDAVRNSPSRSLKLDDDELQRPAESDDDEKSSASHESTGGDKPAHSTAEVRYHLAPLPEGSFTCSLAASVGV